MSYQNIYNLIVVLVDQHYIILPKDHMFTKSEYIHMIVEDIVEHYDSTSLFDKDEYTINLLRDVKRLLNMLIV